MRARAQLSRVKPDNPGPASQPVNGAAGDPHPCPHFARPACRPVIPADGDAAFQPLPTPHGGPAIWTGFLRSARHRRHMAEDPATGPGAGNCSSPMACAPWPSASRRPACRGSTHACRPVLGRAQPGAAIWPNTIAPTDAVLQRRDSHASGSSQSSGRHFLPGPLRRPMCIAGIEEDVRSAGGRARALGPAGRQGRSTWPRAYYPLAIWHDCAAAMPWTSASSFVRYAEIAVAEQPATFDPLASDRQAEPNLARQLVERRPWQAVDATSPAVVLLSVPSRRSACGFRHCPDHQAALPADRHRAGRRLCQRQAARAGRAARDLTHFDFVTLDAGERCCLRCSDGTCAASAADRAWCARYCRAMTQGKVRYISMSGVRLRRVCRGRHAHLGRPAAAPIPVAAGHAQPHAQRLWVTALEQAHRSPWLLPGRVQLLRCEPGLHIPAATGRQRRRAGRDRIEAIVAGTSQTGFHFVDEAAAPGSSKALPCRELIAAQRPASPGGAMCASEKTFTPEAGRGFRWPDELRRYRSAGRSGSGFRNRLRLAPTGKKRDRGSRWARVTRGRSRRPAASRSTPIPGVTAPTARPCRTRRTPLDVCASCCFSTAAALQSWLLLTAFRLSVHPPAPRPWASTPRNTASSRRRLPEGNFAKNDRSFIGPTGVTTATHPRAALRGWPSTAGRTASALERMCAWFPFQGAQASTGRRDRIARALQQTMERIASCACWINQYFISIYQ